MSLDVSVVTVEGLEDPVVVGSPHDEVADIHEIALVVEQSDLLAPRRNLQVNQLVLREFAPFGHFVNPFVVRRLRELCLYTTITFLLYNVNL